MPHQARKISRAEVQEAIDIENEEYPSLEKENYEVWGKSALPIDPGLVGPAEMIKSLAASKGRSTDYAIQQIQRIVEARRTAPLVELTHEISRSVDLREKISQLSPNSRKIIDFFKTTNQARLLSMIFGQKDPLKERRADYHGYALHLWKNTPIPRSLWTDIIVNHVEHFELAANNFTEELGPPLLKRVRSMIRRASKENLLPIQEQRLRDVFKRTQVILADSLYPGIESIGGFYNNGEECIGLSSTLFEKGNYNKELVEEVVIHEYLHALEGQSAITYTDGRIFSDYDLADMEVTREEANTYPEWQPKSSHSFLRKGLTFRTGEIDDVKSTRFTWLNEAVTEIIADSIKPNRKHGTYHEYRKATQYLLEEGIEKMPFSLLSDAYFEDYDPKAKEKIPKWKKLRASINTSHGPDFLVKFDDAIRTHGVGQAIESAKAGFVNN